MRLNSHQLVGKVARTWLQSAINILSGDLGNKARYEDAWTRAKLDNISLMLNSCLAAEGRVGLMLNVRKDDLDRVTSILPAMRNPTISHLSSAEWLAVNTIIEEATVRTIIPALRDAGATGIIEYPINKMIE